MMTLIILTACVSGDGFAHAPPINPRFNTRTVVKTKTVSRAALCRCHGSGNNVCECARGSCGDPNCPSKPVPLAGTRQEPVTVERPQLSHYEYVRSCGPNGCTMQRVARYRVRRGR